jgi:hypothetical protein
MCYHCRGSLHCLIVLLMMAVKARSNLPALERSHYRSLYCSSHWRWEVKPIVRDYLVNTASLCPGFGILKCLTIRCHLLERRETKAQRPGHSLYLRFLYWRMRIKSGEESPAQVGRIFSPPAPSEHVVESCGLSRIGCRRLLYQMPLKR